MTPAPNAPLGVSVDRVPHAERTRSCENPVMPDSVSESTGTAAYHERQETLRLAGGVADLQILDAGCGSGPLTEVLRARKGIPSAFHGSPAMVELARPWLGSMSLALVWSSATLERAA